MQEMNENIYFEYRKKAAMCNERLNSRAGAAEALGISESTLTHYELGITKNMPVDVVVMMAELYGAPELKCYYCKEECPIGKDLPIATQMGTIEGVTIRLLDGLDEEKLNRVRRTMVKIAADGQVEEREKDELRSVTEMMDNLYKSVSELRMLTERYTETERK